jgi:hypothetical protein
MSVHAFLIARKRWNKVHSDSCGSVGSLPRLLLLVDLLLLLLPWIAVRDPAQALNNIQQKAFHCFSRSAEGGLQLRP